MSATVSEDAVGKDVLDADGDKIGIIAAVDHGTARVEPDPGITDKLKAALNWEDTSEDTFPLQEEAIAATTDDAIRLKHSR